MQWYFIDGNINSDSHLYVLNNFVLTQLQHPIGKRKFSTFFCFFIQVLRILIKKSTCFGCRIELRLTGITSWNSVLHHEIEDFHDHQTSPCDFFMELYEISSIRLSTQIHDINDSVQRILLELPELAGTSFMRIAVRATQKRSYLCIEKCGRQVELKWFYRNFHVICKIGFNFS